MIDVPQGSAPARPPEAPAEVPAEVPAEGRAARRVLGLAAVLVLAQLLSRAWIARGGVLSQEALVVAGRSARQPLFSEGFLLPDPGRFTPLADLLTAGLTRLAPLEYWPMAATLVALQAVASLAVLRLLRQLLGDRPVLLLPLALYLFSPLALPAFDSWSTAVSALPFHAGLAWVCGNAIALWRTGRRRYACTGTLVLAVVLPFGAASVVIPVVAFAVLAVLLRQAGEPSPVPAALRRGAWLWAGLATVTAVVAGRHWPAVEPRIVPADRSGSVTTALDTIGVTLGDGVLPGLVGGPLYWSEIGTWADPPGLLVATAVVVAVLTVAWASWHRRGTGVIWLLVAGYVGAGLLLLVGRLTTGIPPEFALDLRLLHDIVPVTAIALALVARAPRREQARRALLDETERRDAGVLLVVFFIGLSGWSTVTYDLIRDDQPVEDYLTTARAALLAEGDVPMLDQAVPERVVWSAAHPDNQASVVFAPLEQGPRFGDWATELRRLDDLGNVVDVRLVEKRTAVVGPVPGCGHPVNGDAPTELPYEGELFAWGWVVQLNYLASQDGVVEVAFESGAPTRVPVERGANTVYLNLAGGGGHIEVTSRTQGLGVCVSGAVVGELQP